MAYVDKARVEGTLYDISPSPTGNLDSTSDNAYTSSDVAQANATTWTNVDPILNTEQHRSIFSKVTGMIKNIRYLYNLVGSGTFAPGNGTTVTDVVNNKAPKSHTHTAAQLPTSNSQINSTSYVPTSALIYSMNQTLNSLNDALEDVDQNLPLKNNSEYDYSHKLIATFNNENDVKNFFSIYNHDNSYNGLKLGQKIRINNSTYYSGTSKDWYIAGFDMEHNQTAADGSTYDNGYGIFLVPPSYIFNSSSQTMSFSWGTNYYDPITPFMSSSLHTSTLPAIASGLQSVLGSCLVYRNVLLGSNIGSTYPAYTSSYGWTKTFISIMSIQQILGGGYSYIANQYDTGEATYKLPLYNFMNPCDFPSSSEYPRFTRAIIRTINYRNYTEIKYIAYCGKVNDTSTGNIEFTKFSTYSGGYAALLPLICINYDA